MTLIECWLRYRSGRNQQSYYIIFIYTIKYPYLKKFYTSNFGAWSVAAQKLAHKRQRWKLEMLQDFITEIFCLGFLVSEREFKSGFSFWRSACASADTNDMMHRVENRNFSI